MKILLYTGYRTGSRSLGEFLTNEIHVEYHHEPLNKNGSYNLEKNGNFNLDNLEKYTVKFSPADDFNFKDNINKFDKIIILYRENIKEQAESLIWAEDKKLFHGGWQDDGTMNFAHYTIDDLFLKNNVDKIDKLIEKIKTENKYMISLNVGLLLTYEELFFSEIGLNKLETYLDVKFKTKLNPINKLRNGIIKKNII
jgi:hypothetical protein